MYEKKCNKCGIKQSVENFIKEKKKNSKGEAVFYRRGICKDCVSNRRKELYKPKTKLKKKLDEKIKSTTKICSKCGEEKNKTSEFFHADSQKLDGFSSSCKVCKNRENLKITQTKEYKKYKNGYDKKYRQTDAGKERDRKKQERRNELYYSDDEYKQKELDRGVRYRAKDAANGGVIQKANQERVKKKYRTDPEFRKVQLANQRMYRKTKDVYKTWNKKYIKRNKHKFACRQMLKDFLRRMKKGKTDRTHAMLGYDFEKFKQRLEMNFEPGMSWENHGEWHIDHKKPISRFKKDTPANVVNALSNLQPLWAEDNLLKGDTFKGK